MMYKKAFLSCQSSSELKRLNCTIHRNCRKLLDPHLLGVVLKSQQRVQIRCTSYERDVKFLKQMAGFIVLAGNRKCQ